MGCKTCFEDYICRCIPYEEVLTINVALPELVTGYNYKLTDKTGAVYEGEVAWTDRAIDIAVAGFPDGFFTEFSGKFKLEIINNETCSAVPLQMVRSYDCIEFEVVAGSTQKQTIGCEFPVCEEVP